MSVNTYFCYCCLSDKDLISLFNTTDLNGKEESYADMLHSSFTIKISKSEIEDFDTYICEVCASELKNATVFRNLVMKTLNVLEINNVIKTTNCDGYLLVEKVREENTLEEFTEESNINYNSDINLKEECSEEFEEVEYLDLILTEDIVSDELNLINLGEVEEELIHSNKKDNIEKKRKPPKRIRPGINNEKKKKTPKPKKPQIRTVEKIPYEVTENLECPMCTNEKFATAKTYHIHMNIHYPNYLCPTCGRGFATKLRLQRHVQTHDDGLYICSKCDQVCKTKEALRSHNKRKHSEVKLNKCTVCEDRFNSYHERMIHLAKVHGINDKAHNCKYCSKTFCGSANLYSHVKHVHMKKKYVCPFCKAGFVREERLEAHITSHTGERNYMCSLCKKTFKNEIAVRVHIKKKHTVQNE